LLQFPRRRRTSPSRTAAFNSRCGQSRFVASRAVCPTRRLRIRDQAPAAASSLGVLPLPLCLQVVNTVRVNEVVDNSTLLDQYMKEITQLREALASGRMEAGETGTDDPA
jgi:hypothetical protein